MMNSIDEYNYLRFMQVNNWKSILNFTNRRTYNLDSCLHFHTWPSWNTHFQPDKCKMSTEARCNIQAIFIPTYFKNIYLECPCLQSNNVFLETRIVASYW